MNKQFTNTLHEVVVLAGAAGTVTAGGSVPQTGVAGAVIVGTVAPSG